MVFSSTIFLFVFLPITLFIYYLIGNKYKNIVLLIASLLFYAYGEPKFVFIMLGSILCNYLFALGIERFEKQRKLFLIISVIGNLGMLFIFKYLGFSCRILNQLFGNNRLMIQIALPIGISFFTFQAMSYVIDVYKGEVKAQHNLFDLALYISMFPQLVAGPIVRYSTVVAQIQSRTIKPEVVGAGCKRFMVGLCKKVILSNNLAVVSEHYFSMQADEMSVVGAWIGAICFTLQIYYDFSGYSDMAIGLGKMLGFDFEENFNYPYVSKSVSEFWHRWHISLSRWFRDYVYIPLGGSRVSVPRHIFNLGVVWLLTGIWHGANYNFIFWGLMYFVALVLEKYFIKIEKRGKIVQVLYHIPTLLYVNFGWVIFNATGIKEGLRYCLSMIGVYFNNALIDASSYGMLREYGFFIIVGIIFAIPVAPHVGKWVEKRAPFVTHGILPFVYLAGFLWAVSFLILGAHNPFIYFNF